MSTLNDGPDSRRRLGDLLVAAGVLSKAQLAELLTARTVVDGRKERIGEAAVRLGLCTSDEVGQALAHQMGLEYLDGQLLTVDESVANQVSPALAERHLVMPLWREGDDVVVACADPTNIIGLDDVRVAVGARRVRPVVAPGYALRHAIGQAYAAENHRSDLAGLRRSASANDSELAQVERGPVVKLADEVIAGGVRAGASDIHVEPKPDRTLIRHRIDGALVEALSLPAGVAGPLISRLKLMGSLDIAEKRRPQDGRAHFRGEGGRPEEAVDLRMSTLPSTHGESMVIRLLRRQGGVVALEEIGLSPQQAAQLIGGIERPQGLVLVTGPTGSGKTSTLYAMLAHLATMDRKLVTVEDPVEYELEGIVQTQVNERAGYATARAMRTMLRQDPDVIMVGEIRDPESAELALEASLTGHLVLSTLHTNDAVSAVTRLGELGMPGYLVSASLSLVVAQRLTRKVCRDCSRPAPPTERHRTRLRLPADDQAVYVDGGGCRSCSHSGYRGRVGVFEILNVDGQMRELIGEGASAERLTRRGRSLGMRSLRENALLKAAEGQTSLDEVLRVTPRPDSSTLGCEGCGGETRADFLVCPWCAAELRPRGCAGCERQLEIGWRVCPSCGTSAGASSGEADLAQSGGLPSVLIVEDDDSVRAALGAMLTGDFEVVSAASGAEALEMIHLHRLDAVVLDKGLPDMDGYEVTRQIRARSAVRDLPVMIVTGHDDPEIETEGLRAGADDWIAKPMDLEVFLARLGRLVRNRRAA